MKSFTRYRAPKRIVLPSVEDTIEQGMLIASAGIRLAVKNLAIVRTLRERRDFDLDWYLDAVREQARLLEREAADDVRRVDEAIQSDELADDAGLPPELREDRRLDRRRAMLVGLRHALDELIADDAAVEALALASRDAALADLGDAIRSAAPDPRRTVKGPARDGAIDALKAQLQLMELDQVERSWGSD